MLTLTRKSDYALVALTHLARAQGQVSSAREMASVYKVPLPILMNILKTLSQHGIVTSIRGSRGGYRLALAPRDISLFRVVAAIEGTVRLFPCAQVSEHGKLSSCDQESCCPITAPARRVSGRLQQFLDEVTLEEIAGGTSPAATSTRALAKELQS